MRFEYVCEGCGVINAAALDPLVEVRDEQIASLREDVQNLELELRKYRSRINRAVKALEAE